MNPLDKKTVVVTGGAGFMGSHLCDKLVRDNQVVCIDDFTSSSEGNIDHLLRNPNFAFIKHDMIEPVDLLQFPELERFNVEFKGVQEIYNLAAPTSPKHFEKMLIKTLKTNSVATINALELAVKYKAKFLHVSSSVVYGPRKEDNPYFKEDYKGYVDMLNARASYDEGKRYAETCVDTYKRFYGIDTRIARVFRTYGPRMPIGVGHMVPDFILNALDNKDLVIYGDEKFNSSFCYIGDIIDGILKLMESDETGPVNFGDPNVYKIIEIAQKIVSMTSSKSKIVFEKPLLFMSSLGLPDITLAKEKMGWLPITILEEGLRKTIDYTMAHKDLLHIQYAEANKEENSAPA